MRMIAVESRSRRERGRGGGESGDPANSVWAIEEGMEGEEPTLRRPSSKGLSLSPFERHSALLRQRFLLMSMGRKDPDVASAAAFPFPTFSVPLFVHTVMGPLGERKADADGGSRSRVEAVTVAAAALAHRSKSQ